MRGPTPPGPFAAILAFAFVFALGAAGGARAAADALAAGDGWQPGTFAVLCYHDVRDDFRAHPDVYTIETQQLIFQFEWLRSHGYHVVSLAEVVAARRNQATLPDHAVVLTFDDGFDSVYSRVFPLLQAFHYPATVALAGVWLDDAKSADGRVEYGDESLPRGAFLRRDQIRAMQRSGLVEFASHTYALHEGIPANPQGNLEPAAVSWRYDPGRHAYEDEAAHVARIRDDLERSRAEVLHLSGVPPRAIVWPYGAHDSMTDRIAAEFGMTIGFTLELGWNTPQTPDRSLHRTLITHDHGLADFANVLQQPFRPAPVRAMQVDLDFVYDPDLAQQEANLSLLLDRVKAMGVNTVYLQAFADPEGSGTAGALYFPNRRLPMRADLFNRAAWQLRTRTGVAVYAWMPLLAFDLEATDPAHGHWVAAAPATRAGKVRRLSPFDPLVRAAVADIYRDLSAHAPIQGLLFSDDATLNDFEDAGPDALRTYGEWGLPTDVAAIRADASLAARWSERKIEYLTRFSQDAAAIVSADHDGLLLARNLFAAVVTQPQSTAWFGQSMPSALGAYDYVALMAMPYLEERRGDANSWLAGLADAVARIPGGLAKTVFELQSVDWAQHNQPVSGATLASQIAILRRAGASQFAYYPDDFRHGRPSIDELRPALGTVLRP